MFLLFNTNRHNTTINDWKYAVQKRLQDTIVLLSDFSDPVIFFAFFINLRRDQIPVCFHQHLDLVDIRRRSPEPKFTPSISLQGTAVHHDHFHYLQKIFFISFLSQLILLLRIRKEFWLGPLRSLHSFRNRSLKRSASTKEIIQHYYFMPSLHTNINKKLPDCLANLLESS